MESESKASAQRDPLRTTMTVLVALVVLAVGVIGYVVYDNLQRSDSPLTVVEDGDTVLMNYVGMFEDGRVFDTSVYEIASNDALYAKSFTFTLREEDSYEPFEMTAGLYGESGGTIKGFALGVIGMKLNQKSIIVVAPEDGYAVDPDMVETVDLLEEVPVVETLLETEFRSLFGVAPTVMGIASHYKWGWDVLITQVASGFVTFKSIPVVGDIVTPYGDPNDPDEPTGWQCVVQSYDPTADGGDGRIGVRHLITEEDTYMREGVDHLGASFVLSAVDEDAGTFQIHQIDTETGYNGEISGRTLLFEVTILEIS
jgi:FKBP-type peptidyl-prolyl cis-trans isomerase 2